MKNKGFTLVELMAVIIILAIVTTIAYSSFRSVNTKIRKQQFENKISLIETKAAEYANDTKIMITNVDTLVKKGYLAADTEDGIVLSPIDNSSMNCYVFTMYKSEDNYYGEYLEKEECDASKLDTVNGNITINKYVWKNEKRDKSLEKDEWTKEDVELEIQINNSDTISDTEISSVKWISQLGEETNTSMTKIVNASYLIDTTYTVEITMINGNKYRAETLVRIDKARPSITKVEIEKENDWTNKEKKVTVSAHDEGSGIYGYAITNQEDCTLARYDEYNNEIYEKNLSNGTYYICVKDKVGNLGREFGEAIEIKKVDLTLPVCKIDYSGSMGSNSWYVSNVNFSIDAYDDNGISSKYIFINGEETDQNSFTLNYNTHSYSVQLKVTDLAGNACTDSVTIKRDANRPNPSASDLKLGKQDYNFVDNVNPGYSISGGSVSCDPSSSRKTGSYTVNCTVTGGNGLSSSVSFNVVHSYPATKVTTDKEKYNCRQECGCEPSACCSSGECVNGSQCNCNNQTGQCWPCTVCCNCGTVEKCDYRCPSGYSEDSSGKCYKYTCPDGGSLSGTTCYY